jgi:hypothetical protein
MRSMAASTSSMDFTSPLRTNSACAVASRKVSSSNLPMIALLPINGWNFKLSVAGMKVKRRPH